MNDAIDQLADQLLTPERRARLEAVAWRRFGCLTAVFDNAYHPQNISACLRTAEALGVPRVHLVSDQDLFIHRKVAKNAHRWVEAPQYETVEEAIEAVTHAGFTLIGTDMAEDAVPYTELPLPDKMALVMGSESDGLSEVMRRACDAIITIPMSGFSQSLNLSAAFAMILSDVARRYTEERGEDACLDAADRDALLEEWIRRDLDKISHGNLNVMIDKYGDTFHRLDSEP
jgi:tRNA (guanosine-2'-O-)-methyltransferase